MVMVANRTEEEIEVKDLFFERNDFIYRESWIKYIRGAKLRKEEFKDEDKFWMYFLLRLDIVNYAVIIIDGLKRSGKSLFASWLAWQLRRLFGKNATLNYHPKEGFGKYHYINEELFIEEWVKLTKLADREDANQLIHDLTKMTALSPFYNATIVIDEAKKWAWKRKPNARLLGYLLELADLVGHNHNVMLFMCPNAEKVVDFNIWDGRTHVIHPSFNTVYKNCATYSILNRNTKQVEWLHLPAPKYGFLWESENLIAMGRPLTKKQVNDALKRARGEDD
jgi:hypothetical protein